MNPRNPVPPLNGDTGGKGATMTGKILIVDDERDMLLLLQRIISEETAYWVDIESDPVLAVERFKQQNYDMVITDLKMPKMDGIRLLESVKKINPRVNVVILTAFATIDNAVEAVQKGAYDYITKPFQRERILLTINKVMEWQQMFNENIKLREALAVKEGVPPLVGQSPGIKNILHRIQQVAPTMATVLITGASGTGKELVARAIHQFSTRSHQKMITINCTAIPEHVIESELFGHVKGAFTGAWKDKKGLVEEADGGTLFLDEIGDLSPQLQTKLLRLLQEGEYKPVGSEITKWADLRFISATNHDLRLEMREKRFREDLFYRLNVVKIDLPALNERKSDIPLLAHYFLQKYNDLYRKDIRRISQKAMHALMSHEYPGNVRELENIIERGIIFCTSEELGSEDLFIESEFESVCPDLNNLAADMSFKDAKERMIQKFHNQYICKLLEKSNGNISRAAEIAGIQRQYLHRLMKEVDIDADNFKEAKR
jgi:DNA-binding NtrC family response regulator